MLKKSYIQFYLAGRDAKLLKDDTDDKQLVARVVAGDGDLRSVALEAARAAAKPHESGRSKTRWVHDYADAIKSAGGSQEEAHAHFMLGRIDALAYSLEADLLEELGEMEGLTEMDVEGEEESADVG